MKRTILHIAMLACALAALPAGAKTVYEDRYAAQVNKTIITVSDVLGTIQPVEKQLRETYDGKELEEKLTDLFQQGLDSLIERELVLAEFEAQKGEVPERYVDEEINRIIRERFDNNRVAFYDALAEERMSMEQWREETRKRLVVSIMRRREVTDRVTVSPRAVLDEYERRAAEFRVPEKIHLRVLVLNKGTNDADRVAKLGEAESIRARLVGGEDFAQLARTESEGVKAGEGGDLGWLDPSTLRPELSNGVSRLAEQDISPVIETQDELWIVRIEGRQEATTLPFDQVSKDLETELRKRETDRLYTAWIDRLKRKNFVKIFESEGAQPAASAEP